ncbi:MAG: putative Sensor protein yycG [Deltaproteobacteria bacterium]|nr:putative Sensor protein yycG [Deltaproteobacteria bacterium]
MKRLWNHSLVAKVFLSYFVVIALLFAGFYFYSNEQVREFHIATLSARMDQEAHLLGRVLPFDVEGLPLDTLCRQLARDLGSRITVIAMDGRVLGDSSEPSARMDNHAARPEVIEAQRGGSGTAIRFSTTVGYDLLYRALHQAGAGQERIVRVATPLKEVETVIRSLRQSLLTGLIVASATGLLLAWVFSRYLSRRVRRLARFSGQVASGAFPKNFFSHSGGDEIALLERHLNEMSLKIRANIEHITGEKEKTESILRCMIEGVLVLDAKGNVVEAKTMFNAPAGRELHGASMLELSRHPEIRTIVQDVLKLDFTSASYSKEVEIDDARWFRFNAVPLRNSLGMALGSIMVFHDITDIKKLENMRADFVANVSHELRTPLTAIRGYVETLLHTPPADAEDRRQFLEIIERHAERLSRLTEDLLTLSDLEAGKIQLSLKPLEPQQLIRRVLEVFWDQAAKQNVKLSQSIDERLPAILGDADRLQQLFINLVDNAIKYTPAGGAVSLSAAEAGNGTGEPHQVEIAVADTGAGIPEKDLPHLTERFYRVDKARSRDLGGTGLGLAIVKHIVQAHAGELQIESVVHQGTTVRVRLPIAESMQTAQTILFLCTGNSCRSQMAEGFARQLGNGSYRFFSAGTEPKAVHPLAVRVMQEAGVDISRQSSKGLASVPLNSINQIITLCGDADERCPTLNARVKRSHWPLPDPAAALGSDEEVLPLFRRVRDEIRRRVQALLA